MRERGSHDKHLQKAGQIQKNPRKEGAPRGHSQLGLCSWPDETEKGPKGHIKGGQAQGGKLLKRHLAAQVGRQFKMRGNLKKLLGISGEGPVGARGEQTR